MFHCKKNLKLELRKQQGWIVHVFFKLQGLWAPDEFFKTSKFKYFSTGSCQMLLLYFKSFWRLHARLSTFHCSPVHRKTKQWGKYFLVSGGFRGGDRWPHPKRNKTCKCQKCLFSKRFSPYPPLYIKERLSHSVWFCSNPFINDMSTEFAYSSYYRKLPTIVTRLPRRFRVLLLKILHPAAGDRTEVSFCNIEQFFLLSWASWFSLAPSKSFHPAVRGPKFLFATFRNIKQFPPLSWSSHYSITTSQLIFLLNIPPSHCDGTEVPSGCVNGTFFTREVILTLKPSVQSTCMEESTMSVTLPSWVGLLTGWEHAPSVCSCIMMIGLQSIPRGLDDDRKWRGGHVRGPSKTSNTSLLIHLKCEVESLRGAFGKFYAKIFGNCGLGRGEKEESKRPPPSFTHSILGFTVPVLFTIMSAAKWHANQDLSTSRR